MAEGQDCNLPFMPGQYAAGTNTYFINFRLTQFFDILRLELEKKKKNNGLLEKCALQCKVKNAQLWLS